MVKLDYLKLNVERLSWVDRQQVNIIDLPATGRITQDWGNVTNFTLHGWTPADAGMAGAEELRAIKANRKPVVLRIDSNSWTVQCMDFTFDELMSGEVEFTLALEVLERPQEFVYQPQAEMQAADLSATYLAAIKLKMQAFWWLGISDRVFIWLTQAVNAVATIRNLLADAVNLATVPAQVLGQVQFAANLVLQQVGLFRDEIESQFSDSPKYSDGEETRKQALLLARETERQMRLLSASCASIPKREQKYVVVEGDTLPRIAARLTQERNRSLDWLDLARANQIEDFGTITSGRELVVPS